VTGAPPGGGKPGAFLHLPNGRGRRHPASVSDENDLWKSSPSQWLNLGSFLLALAMAAVIIAGAIFFGFPAAFFALVIPLGHALWRYLTVRCYVFELTTQRLRISTGVINHHIDEIELYRVKDILVMRPWWMRLTGLSSLSLETSDRTLPKLIIPAMRDGFGLREKLRRQVEAERDRKRVREMDFDGSGDPEFV